MDELYIQKVLTGDPDAFRYFIKKYKDIGYSLAISVVKDEFDAREVLQNSFISAYKKLAAFKGKSKFSTWFYRILINEAFKSLKTKQKNNIDIESISGKLPDSDYFEMNAREENQKYYISEALKKINPNESLALRLFYLEECSIEEITDITGWSCSNVKVILHRGRYNMKTILKKLFESNKAFYHERY